MKSWRAFWSAFASLRWYDAFIEFLFRFTAKTSEPLLAIGIIYSAAIILSEGALDSRNAFFDIFWAITQAIAIESSGGVVLVYGLQSLRDHDRAKAILYLILSALLAVTGGIMLFMHMAVWKLPPHDPFMIGLFILRCVVSVGYIYLCRTKHIRFRDLRSLDEASAPANQAAAVEAAPATTPAVEIDYERLADALLPRLQPLLMAQRTTLVQEVAALASAATVPSAEGGTPQIKATPPVSTDQQEGAGQNREETEQERHARLELAYQELLANSGGKRVSGRALGERTRISRTACIAWLRKHHPENAEQGVRHGKTQQIAGEARQHAEEPVPAWALHNSAAQANGVVAADMISTHDEEPVRDQEARTEEIPLVLFTDSH